MRQFERTIGVDYSGAQTADANLAGIRVYEAKGSGEAVEVPPSPTQPGRKNWSRRDLAEWLVETLASGPPTIVGIDHGFSFPMRYFEVHRIEPDWDVFLDDFVDHWPTDARNVYVDFIREGKVGAGNLRTGASRWRRIAEESCGAKSVFHFDVQGSVAKSTHAGIPWLRHLRRAMPGLHFWPFDGWLPADGASVVCEIYPSLYAKSLPRDGRNPHQQDAWAAATWLRDRDASGGLAQDFQPEMPSGMRAEAGVEGWILGVSAPPLPYGCT
jgi:hypothetical protein